MVSMLLSKAISITGQTSLALIAFTYATPTLAASPSSNQTTTVPITINSTVVRTKPSANYLLGGGDRVRITIADAPENSGEYQIPPDGSLFLPLIGSVSVQGLTQSQASDTISAKYAHFLRRPLTTVSLVAPRPVNVIVSGEVNSPGTFTVGTQGAGGGGIQFPTVVSAIEQAQGTTLAADISHVELHRQQGEGLPDQIINIDLRQLVQQGKRPGDITLRDGDTIFVPAATNVNLAENRQFATANFAAPATLPRTVTVVGEVNRPGPYVVIGGATSGQTNLTQGGTIAQGTANTAGLPTVSRAIQLAGGINSTADIRNIKIRRATKSGTEVMIPVNLMQLIATGDVSQDAVVQEGDSIVVPKATQLTPAEETQLAATNLAPDTIQVSIVGEVKNPGMVKIPPNTPLNQALLDAGGFNNSRANRRAVDLIRLNPNGTVTKRLVKVNLTSNPNEQTNPILRNNDIVVISRNGLAKTGDTLGTVFAPILSVFGFARGF